MRIFISFILLIALNNLYAATITAQLDVNPVLVNDTFHLTYSASGSVDDDPDFSPIEKNFELLGTQQSSNMSVVNGNITRSKTWRLTLLSKSAGTFILPAISFGSDRSSEVNIVVKKMPVSNTATPNQNFILEMEPSQQSGFVQQQFVITVKLLIAQNITNYQFSDLTTSNPDTLILPLGKDEQYKTYRGTKQYVVVEKKFALFPQTAEILKIKPFIAAVTLSSQSSGGFYDPFNTHATSKRLYSKAVNLTVKAIPAQYSGKNWLPGTSVTLKEEWPENKKMIAGEPVTRTLILEAKGLTSSQLPEINPPAIKGLKQYPDKPESQENIIATGLTSTRKQKIALIPTQAGSYTLPAINIAWWNTKTNKMETAHLAGRTFPVLPAISNTSNTALNQPIGSSIKSKYSASALTVKGQANNEGAIWFWLSGLFFILWLITLALWLRSKSKTAPQQKNIDHTAQSISKNLKQLKIACTKNNAQETKKALLEWAKIIYPQTKPNNLSDIAKHVNEPLKQDIMSLNAYLYSPQTIEWQCDNIYQKCKAHKPMHSDKKTKTNSAKLEPLKPSN